MIESPKNSSIKANKIRAGLHILYREQRRIISEVLPEEKLYALLKENDMLHEYKDVLLKVTLLEQELPEHLGVVSAMFWVKHGDKTSELKKYKEKLIEGALSGDNLLYTDETLGM